MIRLVNVFIAVFSFAFIFAQKTDKVKVNFKDYGVFIDDVLFLDSSCKKFGDPCTYSLALTSHKAFVVKTKTYTSTKKVYDKNTKRWNEIPATSSYLHLTFIDTEDEIYYTRGLNQFMKKLYEAQIFNEDGTLDEKKFKLFRLENGEDEPRSAFN
jgi:hypothetical protein